MSEDGKIQMHLVQMEVSPGRPGENTAKMLAQIDGARRKGAQLVVFPEMAIPGYLIGDEWERRAFLRDCEACGHRIREASEGLTVIFGNVALDWSKRNEDGRVRKYNALFLAEDRRFVGPAGSGYDFVIKTLLPNYREFDDSRHFFDVRKLAMETGRKVEDLVRPVRTMAGVFGCILCEDAWDLDYSISPLRILGAEPVDVFINISCSPYTLNKNHKRNRVFSAVAEELKRPLVYVNNVGIQNNGKTVFTFDGASCVYDGHGHQLAGLPPFEEGTVVVDLPRGAVPDWPPVNLQPDDIATIDRALLYGTRKFMELCGVTRVVVGISGGIDSAVAAALYSRILGPRDLLLVNMPGPFTSPTTVALARQLAANIGSLYAEVPIGESVALAGAQLRDLRLRSLKGGIEEPLTVTDLVMENVQARDRSSRVLAALASAFGGVFTCNANKAEATVGYTTLYGDLGGYLAAIADLWKGEVYELGRYMNRKVFGSEIIPAGCFDIVPSAELSRAQNVDEGKGDPLVYPYHDCLFRSWVESWDRTTPEEILEWYLDGTIDERLEYSGRVSELFPTAGAFIADLEKWWGQYQGMGVAKRIQAPPILAVKRRAFGFDHRESQMGPRYTQRYMELKTKALARL